MSPPSSRNPKFKYPVYPVDQFCNLTLKSKTPLCYQRKKWIRVIALIIHPMLPTLIFKPILTSESVRSNKRWNGYSPAGTDKVSPVKVGQIARAWDMKGVRMMSCFLFNQHCSSFSFFFCWVCCFNAHAVTTVNKLQCFPSSSFVGLWLSK